MTFTNPDGLDRTGVALEMDYPAGLANLSESLFTNDDFCTGGCIGGVCVPGELLN